MEKENLIVKLSIVALIITVISLTIVYAAMSRNLRINGKSSIGDPTWEVKFENLSDKKIIGDANVISEPKISDNSTIINGFNFSFSKPGDSISYSFDVKNKGNINAKISDIVKISPSCSSNLASQFDEKLVCNNLNYELFYTNTNKLVSKNDYLDANKKQNLTLKVTYEGKELPQSVVTVSNISYTLIYVQR